MNLAHLQPAQISAIANKEFGRSVEVHYVPSCNEWRFYRRIYTGLGERRVYLGKTAQKGAVYARAKKYFGG